MLCLIKNNILFLANIWEHFFILHLSLKLHGRKYTNFMWEEQKSDPSWHFFKSKNLMIFIKMIFKTKKTACAQCFRKTENLKRKKKKKRFHSRRTLHYTRTEKCFSLTYHYRNEGQQSVFRLFVVPVAIWDPRHTQVITHHHQRAATFWRSCVGVQSSALKAHGP